MKARTKTRRTSRSQPAAPPGASPAQPTPTRLDEARRALAAALDDLGRLPLRYPMMAALDDPVDRPRAPRDGPGG